MTRPHSSVRIRVHPWPLPLLEAHETRSRAPAAPAADLCHPGFRAFRGSPPAGLMISLFELACRNRHSRSRVLIRQPCRVWLCNQSLSPGTAGMFGRAGASRIERQFLLVELPDVVRVIQLMADSADLSVRRSLPGAAPRGTRRYHLRSERWPRGSTAGRSRPIGRGQ